MSEKNWIVFDIDGTIADCNHRVQYAQAKLWDEFHERAPEDLVIVNVADLMVETSLSGYKIILLTGRPEKYRHATIEWLKKARLEKFYDELIMRPEDNFVQDGPMKVGLLEQRFGSQEDVLANVWFVVDDRESVVETLRNYGLTVFQPAAGGY
jgi:hypothetical protein